MAGEAKKNWCDKEESLELAVLNDITGRVNAAKAFMRFLEYVIYNTDEAGGFLLTSAVLQLGDVLARLTIWNDG